MLRRNIGVHHPHFPWSREAAPDLVRDPGPHSAPTMPAEDKEFSHVVDRRFRASFDQGKSCQFAFYDDQEWMPVGLAPVKREVRVGESAIGFQIQIEYFVEVVDVELKQVGE